jgi:short-subunit dehydrogenase
MRARGRGRLLFVSSVAGRIAQPRQGAYAATKWALEALVQPVVSSLLVASVDYVYRQ